VSYAFNDILIIYKKNKIKLVFLDSLLLREDTLYIACIPNGVFGWYCFSIFEPGFYLKTRNPDPFE
jgi:hypothetical protein